MGTSPRPRPRRDYIEIGRIGMPEAKVTFIHHHVDSCFYRPLNVDTDNYILAVGQEQRDYKTLLRAIAGTGIKLIVVASSPWSTSQIQLDEIGDTTVLSHIPYQELRALYAKARLVVVPLLDVDPADGTTAMVEAMAMAKPLIVSRTNGSIDYVVHNETGICVTPREPNELKETIMSLWEQPNTLNRLGANAREAVEKYMNLDLYVNQVVEIVNKVALTSKV